jgi:peptidoglycan/xylan/chitin deacetylase (PgdA/CDA1 family)
MAKNTLTIICYHGVVEQVPNGYNSSGKHILVAEFEKQIAFLSRQLAIVTMRDIELAARGIGTLPNKCAAITFDDGFLNNLEIAHPVIQKYEVPATLYVATNFISTKSLIWTDELERLILEAPPIPRSITLNSEIIIDLSTLESRQLTLKRVKGKFKSFSPSRRDLAMKTLAESLQFEADEVRHPTLHDFLDWEQLRFMKTSGLWEIGAHTMNHNSLGLLPSREVKEEIVGSMKKVNQELGGTYPPLFSYPEGKKQDIPSYAIDVLKRVGLSTAPSAIGGINEIPFNCPTDYFNLLRNMVGFEGLSFPWQI